jgi:pyruvate dehydrogenase E2 component (dihydrolipoamide acetyltransferase)
MSDADVLNSSALLGMPRLSDSMEEATVTRWLKHNGEPFEVGDPLVEIETDKATVVFEAEHEGTLLEILVGEGESAPLGAPIARVAGTGLPPVATVADANADTDPAPIAVPQTQSLPSSPSRGTIDQPTRARATPVARTLAKTLGVDLFALTGSGPGGRIVRSDVLAAKPTTSDTATTRVPLTTTQKTIARRMRESRTTVPDFTLTYEADVGRALSLRSQLNEALPAPGVSVNDLVVKAVSLALRDFPRLNATYTDDTVLQHEVIDVGVAVAADDVLLVPVIRNADRLSLPELAVETRRLARQARHRQLSPADLEGGSFTVSNLGMFGISSFQAIIYAPQVAILAVGRADRRPGFGSDGSIVERHIMALTLSCDHRAVYGAEAAQFLARVASALEQPFELIMADLTNRISGGA